MVVGRKTLEDLRTSFSFLSSSSSHLSTAGVALSLYSSSSSFFSPSRYPYGPDGTWCTITDGGTGIIWSVGIDTEAWRRTRAAGQLGNRATGARGRRRHGMDRD